ncbi:MAG TPA: hypothetical protein EYP85_11915 [Armatimonadetes bacterium]|nr:hypothetical protein [Armatimonadota bacterium]
MSESAKWWGLAGGLMVIMHLPFAAEGTALGTAAIRQPGPVAPLPGGPRDSLGLSSANPAFSAVGEKEVNHHDEPTVAIPPRPSPPGPQPPRIEPPVQPPLERPRLERPELLLPDVAVQQVEVLPAGLVSGGQGYVVKVTLTNQGGLTSRPIIVRAEVRFGGGQEPAWVSQAEQGPIAVNAQAVVVPPAALDLPLTAQQLTLTVQAQTTPDSNPQNNAQTQILPVTPLPAVLKFGPYQLAVRSYLPGSTLANLRGTATWTVQGAAGPVTLEVPFQNLSAQANGKVTGGQVTHSFSPGVAVPGADDWKLLLRAVRLTPQGGEADLTVRLPVTAGVTVNGKTELALDGQPLPADLQLGPVNLPPNTSFDLRDLPLGIVPTGPITLNLGQEAALQFSTAHTLYWPHRQGNPIPASNDGYLKFTYTVQNGQITPQGFAGELTLAPGHGGTYTALFPRVKVEVQEGQLQIQEGRVAGGELQAEFAFAYLREYTAVPPPATQVKGEVNLTARGPTGSLDGLAQVTPTPPPLTWGVAFRAEAPEGLLYLPGAVTETTPEKHFLAKVDETTFKTDGPNAGWGEDRVDAGLNLLAGKTKLNKFELALKGADKPSEIPNPEPNLYLRPVGVSGVLTSEVSGANPLKAEFWANEHGGQGYRVEFTNVAFSFLDSRVYESQLDGEVTLPPPPDTGLTKEARFVTRNWEINDQGELTQGIVPPGQQKPTDLEYWAVTLTPERVGFEVDNGKHWLSVGGTYEVKFLQDPLSLEGMFGPDGNPHGAMVVHNAPTNSLQGFVFLLEQARLSSTGDPLPWLNNEATVKEFPDLGGVKVGWVELEGSVVLPYFGGRPSTMFVVGHPNANYVGLKEKIELRHEWVDGIEFKYDLAFAQQTDDDQPASFAGAAKWTLLGMGIDSAVVLDGAVNDKPPTAQLTFGLGSITVLYDALRPYYNKVKGVLEDFNKFKQKLKGPGITDEDLEKYDQVMAWVEEHSQDIGLAELAGKLRSTETKEWAQSTTKEVMDWLAEQLESPTGQTIQAIGQDAVDYFNEGLQVLDLPFDVRRVRGKIVIVGEVIEEVFVEASFKVEPVVDNATVAVTATRHRVYTIKLSVKKLKIGGLKPCDGYLNLIIDTAAPSADGSLGVKKLDFKAVKIVSADALFGGGPDKAYFGAAANLKFRSYSLQGAFLAGYNIPVSILEDTGVMEKDVKDILTEAVGDPNGTLTGAYVAGGVSFPLFGDSCLLRVSAGGSLGLWYFATNGDIFGGRLYAFVSGEAICIVTIKGEVVLIGQWITEPPDFWLKGQGKVSGKIDLWLTSLSYSVGVGVSYQDSTGEWDVWVD